MHDVSMDATGICPICDDPDNARGPSQHTAIGASKKMESKLAIAPANAWVYYKMQPEPAAGPSNIQLAMNNTHDKVISI